LLLNLAIGLGVTALVVFVTLLTVNRYQRKLRLAASVDDLTGLANRREGQSMLADAMTEADVKDQKLAAVLVDIDHFKGINDEHGHPTGDRVINGVGGLLRSAVRQDDRVIRWGGDEYLVLLRGCPHNEAVRLGRAMLGNVATQHLLVGATLPPLTVSIGVTEYQVGESREAFLARADRALHRAKANGRNCVHGMRPREGELSQADIADLVAFDVPLHDRSATASEEARQDRRNGPVARRLLRR
jgi:diguanylate cyclase (GGDEF)-like protein